MAVVVGGKGLHVSAVKLAEMGVAWSGASGMVRSGTSQSSVGEGHGAGGGEARQGQVSLSGTSGYEGVGA